MTVKTDNQNSFALLWFGAALPSHLALLSKVLCEFFQFLQVLLVDCRLCVGQRPQHVRLKRRGKKEAKLL